MTIDDFKKLTKTLVILDGATGSNLMASGMPRGVCTEKWIMEHKDLIQKLQTEYIASGSDIIYAPTFGANRISLGKHGLADEIETINQTLVSYSREIAGDKAYVAGDITTTGAICGIDDDYTYEDAFHNYCEQIKILDQAGVDLIVAETMISITETLAAVDAAKTVSSLPIMCTLTVDAAGGIFTGGDAVSAAVQLEAAGADAVGLNCSVGPDQLTAVIHSIKDAVSIPVIVKPNAGMPTIDDKGNAVYHMEPDAFAQHMKVLVENGASIIGGCCGTTPAFIRSIKEILTESIE